MKEVPELHPHFFSTSGRTLFEENVHAAANFVNNTNTEEVIQLIQDVGFIPAQRTTLYEILKVYENAEAA